jgi:SAM-dependent methyltransferase
MQLEDLVRRTAGPEPWAEGDNIPWNEPAFSERMLAEHLSQQHDAASRRVERIERQVRWIHEVLVGRAPTSILDLGCGPGLYSSRLARLGHICLGIDFSPASVDYARETAAREGLACTYVLGDIRHAEYGAPSRYNGDDAEHQRRTVGEALREREGKRQRKGQGDDHDSFGLAMLIYGELNVFRPADARVILRKMHAALTPGGWLLLEPHTFEAVEAMGRASRAWHTAQRGLFSARPHLYLEEHHWDEVTLTATTRYFIVDAITAGVEQHAQSMQAYTEAEYRALLEECGFQDVVFHPSLDGSVEGAHPGLFALTAIRPH